VHRLRDRPLLGRTKEKLGEGGNKGRKKVRTRSRETGNREKSSFQGELGGTRGVTGNIKAG